MADETIGSALKRAREEAGLTLRDVSRASGISVNQISQVETGRRADPAFTTVARIAAGLRLSLDSVSRAVGFVADGPVLRSRISAAGRKRLAAYRELEDVVEVAADVSQRVRTALKAFTDEDLVGDEKAPSSKKPRPRREKLL
ncbi:MAG: helix-turn-helix domain-containing protein [Candidatus Eremiobacteraeota bacterium]|nr:helix-turn-helix domain-containing protein [Candidatus Eremiobacteraeota bacterium]